MKGHRLSEEGFGPHHITSGTQSNIHQIALFINAAIQIASRAVDSNVSFIDMPDLAHFCFALGSALFVTTQAEGEAIEGCQKKGQSEHP